MATETFTDSFGGLSPVVPREFSGTELGSQTTDYTISDLSLRTLFMEFSNTTSAVVLPDSNQLGVGAAFIVSNTGANAFDIDDSAGTKIQDVDVGESYYVVLTDDSTEAGSWRSTAFGATVSAATAGDLQGSGLSANGSVLDVNVDDSTIEINADTLRVKASGIGDNELDYSEAATSLAGTGLQAFSNAIRIAATAAGDGLQGGGGSALAVDVSDFAGNGLTDDGSENLELDFNGMGASLTAENIESQTDLIAIDDVSAGVVKKIAISEFRVPQIVKTETGTTYTVTDGDEDNLLVFSSGSAVTVTLPNSLQQGFRFDTIASGTGDVSFSAASGATLNNEDGHSTIAGQWGKVELIVIENTDDTSAVYVLSGNTKA